MIYKVAVLLVCVFCLTTADEGDSCVRNGSPGTCINIRKCQSAIEELKKRITPQICSFIGADPVVCCTDNANPAPTTTTKAPVITTTPRQQQPTTSEEPEIDYVNNDGTPLGCEPLSTKLTSKKIGRKAWDMCVEYQQTLVYPCKKSVSLVSGGMNRNHLCHHNADDLIVGGENASENEFTHMVLLGYGSDLPTVQWLCGGSLISDRWILTAGHCTYDRRVIVSYARVGILKRSEPMSDDRVRRIVEVKSAPKYAPPSRYEDIALLRMEQPVKLSQFLVPACVHIGDSVAEDRVLATGWGLTEHRGADVADHLQKVILNQFSYEECSPQYPQGLRLLKEGLQNQTQICYGDRELEKDTCQGDSGGPIQIKSKKLHCMYVITGVTSFGKRCGRPGDPAIYTRVSHYAEWIESIVWP